jgi:hypothetical protein
MQMEKEEMSKKLPLTMFELMFRRWNKYERGLLKFAWKPSWQRVNYISTEGAEHQRWFIYIGRMVIEINIARDAIEKDHKSISQKDKSNAEG